MIRPSFATVPNRRATQLAPVSQQSRRPARQRESQARVTPIRNSLVTMLLAFFLCVVQTAIATTDSALMPDRNMGPGDVVKIVINALKTNNPDDNDNGIETVFAFASPGNRSATGPLPRFKQMLKSGYGNMLNHSNSEFSPIEIRDNQAWQAVWLALPNGEEAGYLFQMGKQQNGEYQGMWMTEGVFPLPPRGQSI